MYSNMAWRAAWWVGQGWRRSRSILMAAKTPARTQCDEYFVLASGEFEHVERPSDCHGQLGGEQCDAFRQLGSGADDLEKPAAAMIGQAPVPSRSGDLL